MKKTITILTIITAVLATICCVMGIFDKEQYHYEPVKTAWGEEIILYQEGVYARDSVSMASQAVAQDHITLFVGVPILLITLYMATKCGKKWLLFLTGIIGYFFYAYLPYATLVAYNQCYLLYVLLISVGLYNLILCMLQIVKTEFPVHYFAHVPSKALAIFEMITGACLAGMWLSRIVGGALEQTAPVGLEHYSTLTIQTFDLAVIVPLSFVCGYLLLKKNKLGYVLCVLLQVKGIAMAMAVSAMVVGMMRNGVEVTLMEKVFFPTVFVISVAFLSRICLGIKKAEQEA